MPKLRGYRQRNPLNIYDCYAPHRDGRLVLLGDTNIGDVMRSNVHVANQLWCDMTSVITNVRARTNIPLGILADLAFATVITLIVGEMPQRQFCLADLLRRQELDQEAFDKLARTGQQLNDDGSPYVDEEIEALAKKLWSENYFTGEPFDRREELEASWNIVDGVPQKAHWYNMARLARVELRGPNIPVIVPVRQNCSILVEANDRAMNKVRELLIIHQIAPEPLVWIHLEGMVTRDHA